MKRFMRVALLVAALSAFAIGNLLAADPGAPAQPDPATSAAQELQALPAGLTQIDCRPGQATFPPFTRLNGVPGMSESTYVLADGRCFRDTSRPSPSVTTPIIVIPAASANP